MDVGALTILLWAFREREKLLDIYDVLCGARFTTSYTRIGGLQQDWTPQCPRDAPDVPRRASSTDLEEVESLLQSNRIFIDRCENVGYISRADAIAWGVTGPVLRAAGVRARPAP